MSMKMKKLDGIDENEVAFRVNYNPKIYRYISVNLHILSRPHFTSDISAFFAYVHANPNRAITSKEVREVAKIELKKGMDDILRDLGFRGVLAQIFFKEMTNKSIYFRNPVYHRDLNDLGINITDIYGTIFTPKRKTAILPTN